jgi:pyruvate dehydrogenase E1 component beta subunit
LLASIRDDNPVIFCEPKSLMFSEGEVPEGDYEVPLGKAAVVREGGDVTLIGWGRTVHTAAEAAQILAEEGVQAEVIDLRSLYPMDEAAVLASLEKTGRLVVIDEAPPHCGVASDVASLCADRGFDFLNAPVKKVTAPHTPVPFSPVLEDAYLPSADAIVAAVHEQLGWNS